MPTNQEVMENIKELLTEQIMSLSSVPFGALLLPFNAVLNAPLLIEYTFASLGDPEAEFTALPGLSSLIDILRGKAAQTAGAEFSITF